MIRSGILEHSLAGRLGLAELGAYTVIHLQVDFRTGVWWGSAPRILNAAPRGASLREVQRSLATLVDIGFLRPFHRHGQRGNFPWLIHKYRVRTGALRGKQLNAWASISWDAPAYEPCAESDAEPVAEGDAQGVAEGAPNQYSVVQNSREQESGKSSPSNHHFLPATQTAKPMITVPTGELNQKTQTAKRTLIDEGYAPDLVEIALLRVANLAAAKKKSPRTARYFVAAVESNLSDPDELAACRAIVAERTKCGIPMNAPLAVDEWHTASKIAFVHAAVEEGAESGRPASAIAAERLTAVAGMGR